MNRILLVLIINICLITNVLANQLDVNDIKTIICDAELGDKFAQGYLGFLYESGNGVERNYTQAVKWYQKAAEQGHDVAQYNLGLMYHLGKGVQQNDATAVKWFRKAAEQGHQSAQHNLGVMYTNGERIPQD